MVYSDLFRKPDDIAFIGDLTDVFEYGYYYLYKLTMDINLFYGEDLKVYKNRENRKQPCLTKSGCLILIKYLEDNKKDDRGNVRRFKEWLGKPNMDLKYSIISDETIPFKYIEYRGERWYSLDDIITLCKDNIKIPDDKIIKVNSDDYIKASDISSLDLKSDESILKIVKQLNDYTITLPLIPPYPLKNPNNKIFLSEVSFFSRMTIDELTKIIKENEKSCGYVSVDAKKGPYILKQNVIGLINLIHITDRNAKRNMETYAKKLGISEFYEPPSLKNQPDEIGVDIPDYITKPDEIKTNLINEIPVPVSTPTPLKEPLPKPEKLPHDDDVKALTFEDVPFEFKYKDDMWRISLRNLAGHYDIEFKHASEKLTQNGELFQDLESSKVMSETRGHVDDYLMSVRDATTFLTLLNYKRYDDTRRTKLVKMRNWIATTAEQLLTGQAKLTKIIPVASDLSDDPEYITTLSGIRRSLHIVKIREKCPTKPNTVNRINALYRHDQNLVEGDGVEFKQGWYKKLDKAGRKKNCAVKMASFAAIANGCIDVDEIEEYEKKIFQIMPEEYIPEKFVKQLKSGK